MIIKIAGARLKRSKRKWSTLEMIIKIADEH